MLTGLETVAVEPGYTAASPLVFVSYPWSHSMVAVIFWSALMGGLHYAFKNDARAGLTLAGLVYSHWLLDTLVHVPDLKIFPGSETAVGLGLWRSLFWSQALEFGLLGLGLWIYLKTTRPRDRIGRYALAGLIGLLALLQAGNAFGPPPPQGAVSTIAFMALAMWLFVPWGAWIDRHRRGGAN